MNREFLLALLIVTLVTVLAVNIVHATPPSDTLYSNEDVNSGWYMIPDSGYRYEKVQTDDGDTTCIYFNGVFGYQVFGLPDIFADGFTITDVTVYAIVRNDAYNDVAFRLKIWTHDTEYGDFDQWTYVSSQNYQTYSQKWDKNPYTTDTWTADEVNALKAGIQNTYYSGTSTQIRVTQFFVVVNEVPSTVIPEYALGGLLALIACFAAFFIIKRPKLNLRSN